MKNKTCKTQCWEILFDENAKIFEFLAHPVRLRIVCMISKLWKLSAWEIVKNLDLAQNLVSHHLWFLKKSDFLITEKKWTFVYYSLNEEFFGNFKNDLKKIFKI